MIEELRARRRRLSGLAAWQRGRAIQIERECGGETLESAWRRWLAAWLELGVLLMGGGR